MAEHRHKRDTNARRFPKAHVVAGPLALLATISTVGLGVLSASPETRDAFVATGSTSLLDLSERTTVSRSDSRVGAAIVPRKTIKPDREFVETRRAVRRADEKLWTTTELNLWTDSGPKAEKVGLVETGERILVTGRKTAKRVEVVWKGKSRWVTAGYLAAEKPEKDSADSAEGAEGDVTASCTNGTSVPSGVSANIVAVHQAVCANFPEITTYGTFRGDGEHAQGLAVDIMVSGERGWQVAEFVRANYAELGVSYLIYSQRIWSVERGGEGWRGMSDRGSTTANHYDHVHVTTY